jgi:hypothetical protein
VQTLDTTFARAKIVASVNDKSDALALGADVLVEQGD